MIENNAEVFTDFERVHKAYELDPKANQEEFNEEGERVLGIVRKYENMLCGRSEGTGFGKYATNLSDKFREALRKKFPKIDFVGMK